MSSRKSRLQKCLSTICTLVLAGLLQSGCTGLSPARHPASPCLQPEDNDRLAEVVNRLTWGVSATSLARARETGRQCFIEEQLNPPATAALPAEVQAQIDAMEISQGNTADRVREIYAAQRAANDLKDDEEKKAATKAYQQHMQTLERETATRALLRDVYSRYQLREQLVWFWMNHFNVYAGKSNLKATIADFEENAIRPHALGHFRDLLRATVHHPAMLSYLDNDRNRAGHLNENYAREIMELHTMGVDSGYTQQDVQALARILTGMEVNNSGRVPKVPDKLQPLLVEDGLFLFDPRQHDMKDKSFLGTHLYGAGMAEIDNAVDLLARQPATARFISRQLSSFFMGKEASPRLLNSLARTYQQTDGDIAAILRTLFNSREFEASLGHSFKDPVHFVVSAIRLVQDQQPLQNTEIMTGWLNRLGEPLYGHLTPDGYPLDQQAWSSSGQMNTRFDIARNIARLRLPGGHDKGAATLQKNSWPTDILKLSSTTRQILAQARNQEEWRFLYLCSPAMMYR